MSRLRCLTLLLVGVLAGCRSGPSPQGWLDDVGRPAPQVHRLDARPDARPAAFGTTVGAQETQPSAAFTSLGSGRFTAASAAVREAPTRGGQAGVTLNLVGVPIAQAAKAVLGDLLQLNYTVDERVQGAVTVQTSEPVSKAAVVDMFETVLRSRGAAIVEDAGFKRIVPVEEARARLPGFDPGIASAVNPGLAVQIVPVNFVAVAEMQELLQPIAPAGGVLRADAKRNILVLSGTASELAAMRETIALFDIDAMKGMSFALVPLKSSEPAAIVAELGEVFEASGGPMRDLVRFIPNRRLNAVLVAAPRPSYLDEARLWIARFDKVGDARADKLVVYPVHNRPAAELAPILQAVFAGASGASPPASGARGDVAPAVQPMQMRAPAEGEDLVAGPAATGAIGAPFPDDAGSGRGGPSIVADAAENALVIYAAAPDHERIAAMMAQLDRMPTQVLLEATIAEVSLGDDLNFGLRWFFENGNVRGTMTDVAGGAVSAAFPGFSYLFSTANIRVVLNALSSVTDVKIVSSPTLMVLDNKEARLQVGDQVPVITQQARSTTDPDAPVVNAVEMKDTGVILSVRPHVNESGRVVLDINQEVSSVVATTTSGIDSPTIRQRKLATTVVVADGESLALGGLIQDRDALKRTKMPVLGDIPGVGNLFRRKESALLRTELIVFIQPRVVHDVGEARMITEDFRRELTLQPPASRDRRAIMRRDLGRALN